MSAVDGNTLVARALKRHGVDTLFFLMGGPMVECEGAIGREGIRLVDARHEQAAAMMATAYARLRRTPAVCMAASGPGVANLVAGIANAWDDGSPVIAIGGSSPVHSYETLAFQEVDQVAMFKPITRWSARCYETARIPDYVDRAFQMAFGPRPGPVYLDLPGDVLFGEVEDGAGAGRATVALTRPRPQADPALVGHAAQMIMAAERPVLLYGTGVHWSGADKSLRRLVERAQVPFFATPQGRGVIDEHHPLSPLGARGTAFRECDLIVQVGTRQNYIVDNMSGPRWSRDAKLIQIDIDGYEIGRNRKADVPLLGDADAVLTQLEAEIAADQSAPGRSARWVQDLQDEHERKAVRLEEQMKSDSRPIHPLRLCRAVRDAMPDDAVLVVDGQEILNFARQSIPFRMPRSLNSGPFGMMGVGLPLGLGAKIALPDAPVVILHGDGSFGLNAMEMDTAIRHGIPVTCIISNNGGWSANDRPKAGRDLGFTRYDLMFRPLGVHTDWIEDPDQLEPAITEAIASNRPAVLNVKTDPGARAGGYNFTKYVT
jgi:thiamine pyrophosphate-dependent acetolactate synthase large subunit-like protein